MIISLVSAKGGTGKSTLCVNLAALGAKEGLKVGLIDLDPQATACGWQAMRGSGDIEIAVAHPPTLASTAQRMREAGCQLVMVDTPPHHSTAAAAAVRIASLTLVPARPSAFDLAAILETIELVRHANGRAGAVLNAIPASSTVADQAQDVIERAGLKVLARIGQRIAWQHAAARGRGVYETEPGGASASELVRLWNAIHEHMNARTHEDMTS